MNEKILVVDDENSLRRVLCAMLESEGYEVDDACNGAEAISKIANNSYAAVITDLKMPEVDGIELLKHVNDKYRDGGWSSTNSGSVPRRLQHARCGPVRVCCFSGWLFRLRR